MSSKMKKTGIVIAAAAAAAFAMAPVTPALAGKHKVKCYGVNSCRGKSSCKTARSKCKGHNSCKGKGYVKVSRKACKQMGGKAMGRKARRKHKR